MQQFSFTTDKGKPYSVTVPTPKPNFERKFVFAFAKSGSTLLDNLLSVYCQVEGTPTFSLYNQAFDQGLSTAELGSEALPCLDFDGILYTGFRHYPRFELDIGSSKAIWLVRDPRDMAVSMYYSIAKSHVIPKGHEAMTRSRQQTSELDIDEFVVKRMKSYMGQFKQYQKNLANKNVKIYRYEDVIYEKLSWFKGVLTYLDIPVKDKLAENVVKQFDVIPSEEKDDQHIRQVHPGNYKKKLAAETVETLNEQAMDFLRYFNYE
ncbi:sulfotransferase domain-containing protein [Alteromonas halophila]|uniref:Sulfotransferase domain-containing protein n=1 Tax=Alteromonas halophila TaxID=516698 RepID=A0A918JIQ5_9ALTE|nr:sulfotransferase domain-containing protein [Alteromonas halophila]GGW82296.1 hypothetical protein GCM10007391_14160 [Alteromonas halophila]